MHVCARQDGIKILIQEHANRAMLIAHLAFQVSVVQAVYLGGDGTLRESVAHRSYGRRAGGDLLSRGDF